MTLVLSSYAIVKCAVIGRLIAVFRSQKMGISGAFHPMNGRIRITGLTAQW